MVGLLVAVVLLGGLEAILRATTHVYGRATIPAQQVTDHLRTASLRHHPDLGWAHSAGLFRHRDDVSDHRPHGSFRAVAIGDSQTMGAGLPEQESWPSQAERILRERHPGVHIQVIHASAPGYSSLQAIRLMRDHLAFLQPDLWLLDLRPEDAPRDEAFRSTPLDRMLFQWRTYYVLRFAIERLRGRTRAMGTAPGGRSDLGNHDLLLDEAHKQGSRVLFVDYPVWLGDKDQIVCEAPPELLPPGAEVARACLALQARPDAKHELFFDRNHMRASASAVVGRVVADHIDTFGFLGDVAPGRLPRNTPPHLE